MLQYGCVPKFNLHAALNVITGCCGGIVFLFYHLGVVPIALGFGNTKYINMKTNKTLDKKCLYKTGSCCYET